MQKMQMVSVKNLTLIAEINLSEDVLNVHLAIM